MKILDVIHCFPPESMTGSEIYTYNLSLCLAKNHHVSVFYRISNPKQKEYEITKNDYNGLVVYKINNTLKHYYSLEKLYNNREIENKFFEVLEEVKPDIVHIHHLLFLSLGIIHEIKKKNIPIVFTLHDYWLVCPKGQLLKSNLHLCKNSTQIGCSFCLARFLKFKNLLKELFKFLARGMSLRTYSAQLKCIYKDVDLFISPSRFLLNKFINSGMPLEKIMYSDYGINFDLFKDTEKIKSDKIRFDFIGTLIPSKGAHILIKAFNKIKSGRATLKIYGKHFTANKIFGYYYRIRRMARYNKNIKFMGMFDNKDVANIFKEIDVLIFSSVWEENSPLVIHEAIISNTFIIASDLGGVGELVKHGQNGFLFKAGDVRDLQEKMEHIIENPRSIESLKNNMPKIKSIKDNAEELERIYNSLLKSKKGSADN